MHFSSEFLHQIRFHPYIDWISFVFHPGFRARNIWLTKNCPTPERDSNLDVVLFFCVMCICVWNMWCVSFLVIRASHTNTNLQYSALWRAALWCVWLAQWMGSPYRMDFIRAIKKDDNKICFFFFFFSEQSIRIEIELYARVEPPFRIFIWGIFTHQNSVFL